MQSEYPTTTENMIINATKNRGKLKIFFGYAAGVGKTYAMLKEAQELKHSGIDVVIGYLERHQRPDTLELSKNLENIPPKSILYNNKTFYEFDLDEAIRRKPQICLVDELAHTNIKGDRHRKRWLAVEELLESGIDVYSTLNVQHIESLNDVVAQITGIKVRETIPDFVFDKAEQVKLIDIEPEDLIKRLEIGKVYSYEQSIRALSNFFTKENLIALREIALRRSADRVNHAIDNARLQKKTPVLIQATEQILACISASPSSLRIIRTAHRMAEAHHCKWIALHVITYEKDDLNEEDKERLVKYQKLIQELGGEWVTIYGEFTLDTMLEFARFRNVTKIIISKNHRVSSKLFRFYAKDMVDKIMDSKFYMDVYVIPNLNEAPKKKHKWLKKFNISNLNVNDVMNSFAILFGTTMVCKLFDWVGFSELNMILIYILGIMLTYIKTKGYGTGLFFSIVSVFLFNYLFVEPKYSLYIMDKSYLEMMVIMIIVGSIMGGITSRLQRNMKELRTREQRTMLLYRIGKKLLSTTSKDEVAIVGTKYLSRMFNKTVICFIGNGPVLSQPKVYEANNHHKTFVYDHEMEGVAMWCYINQKECGYGTDTFYYSKYYYRPIIGRSGCLGVVGVKCENQQLDPEQKHLFEMVLSQLALAIK